MFFKLIMPNCAMRMNNMVKSGGRETKNIAKRFRNRDFSGNMGIAIKNSSWQVATTIISKIGSLFFVIIVARLLMPELYGLYGLALSTILLIGAFSDFGIGSAAQIFLSKNIDNNKKRAKAFFVYLTKFKLLLIFVTSLILILVAKWIAISYYDKPIFYALIVGALYFPLAQLGDYLKTLFTSRNNFKIMFWGEMVLQFSKLVIIPLTILFLLDRGLSSEVFLFWIFVALSFCVLILGIYYIIMTWIDYPFRNVKGKELSLEERKGVWKFIWPLSITIAFGLFFSSIDMVMLGHYVTSEFIGFYQVAFSLISSATTIIAFSSVAMLPLFSRLKGKRLEQGFKKVLYVTFFISLLSLIFTFVVADYLILFIYGTEYAMASLYLRVLGVLFISFPLIALYQTYYTSQERTKIIATLLILSTTVNIVFNFVFINIGLSYGMKEAVLGACFATIVSRYGYLTGLILFKNFKWK